jgi:hypothetical protein
VAILTVLLVAAGLGVGSATTAAAATSGSMSCYTNWYPEYKKHIIYYDYSGAHYKGMTNYESQGSSQWKMLVVTNIQAWSGGSYYVKDGFVSFWLPSTRWTIRITDAVYKWDGYKWVRVGTTYCEVKKTS